MNFAKIISFSLLVGFAGACSPNLDNPDATFTDVEFKTHGMANETVKAVYGFQYNNQTDAWFKAKLLSDQIICYGVVEGSFNSRFFPSSDFKTALWMEKNVVVSKNALKGTVRAPLNACKAAVGAQRLVLPITLANRRTQGLQADAGKPSQISYDGLIDKKKFATFTVDLRPGRDGIWATDELYLDEVCEDGHFNLMCDFSFDLAGIIEIIFRKEPTQ